MDCSSEILLESRAPSPLPEQHRCLAWARAKYRRTSPSRQSQTTPQRFSCLCNAPRYKNARQACASLEYLSPTPSGRLSYTSRRIQPHRFVRPKFVAKRAVNRSTNHKMTEAHRQSATDNASLPHTIPSTLQESARSQSRGQAHSFSQYKHSPPR